MELQKTFPAGPIYESPSYIITLSLPSTTEMSKRSEKKVRPVLGELNAQLERRYYHKITSVLPSIAWYQNAI